MSLILHHTVLLLMRVGRILLCDRFMSKENILFLLPPHCTLATQPTPPSAPDDVKDGEGAEGWFRRLCINLVAMPSYVVAVWTCNR